MTHYALENVRSIGLPFNGKVRNYTNVVMLKIGTNSGKIFLRCTVNGLYLVNNRCQNFDHRQECLDKNTTPKKKAKIGIEKRMEGVHGPDVFFIFLNR